jgi:1,4-dihydroxy-2-naphthoate octaprenyltransferase
LSLLTALIIGTTCCHISANVFNDYFDWRSGADQTNTDFIMSISGGSRAIEFGIISEKKLFMLAMSNLMIAAICALYIGLVKGPLIIILSLVGAFAIYFYTAPPIRLAARYGLGEVFIFLCFGPVFIAGIIYVLTNNINWQTFFIGAPIGFLITSILLINEYPDLKADAKAKKINLAVILGPNLLPLVVDLLIISCYLTIIIGIILHIFPKSYLLSMFTLPLAIYEMVIINKMHNCSLSLLRATASGEAIHQNRKLIYKACINNIKLYAAFGISCIVAGIINYVYY